MNKKNKLMFVARQYLFMDTNLFTKLFPEQKGKKKAGKVLLYIILHTLIVQFSQKNVNDIPIRDRFRILYFVFLLLFIFKFC